MTAALSVRHRDRWTTDDLDALPEDGVRRELIDGALFVSPSPTSRHQQLVLRLAIALERTRPDQWAVTHGVEVRISRHRSLTPDVLVVDAKADAPGPSHFAPHEVLLVVEVVSPGSTTMDRITKPRLYAHAGIPHYWRIETHPTIAIHTHQLTHHHTYHPTGRHTDRLRASEPGPIDLPVAEFSRIARATG